MTRPVSFGNNSLGSTDSFKEKKIYYEEVFPEDLIPNHISLWDDNRLYGRVNTDNQVIALRESNLSPLKATKGNAAMFAPGFIANAFGDLVDKMDACLKEGKIAPTGPFANIEVVRGWSSVNQEYDRYMKDKIFSTFVEEFLIFEKQSKKIKDFSGFLEVFGGFSKHLGRMLPITRTGFIESTYCTPYTTGLVIDIGIGDYSDDFLKSSEYVNDPNFLFFADAAKQFGFLIDRNAPWRLIANLGSAAMQRYAAASGIELTDNIIENIAIIQDLMYKITSPVDMNILAAYLKDMYNAYAERNPYVFDKIMKQNHKCGSVSKVYEREQIDDITMDESFVGGKYKYRWALRSHYYMRMFERGIKSNLRSDKKRLRHLYDIMDAMSGIVSGYTEAIRTIESEIIGPFASLPIPPETVDENDSLPNY
jgi:hypothetical protein